MPRSSKCKGRLFLRLWSSEQFVNFPFGSRLEHSEDSLSRRKKAQVSREGGGTRAVIKGGAGLLPMARKVFDKRRREAFFRLWRRDSAMVSPHPSSTTTHSLIQYSVHSTTGNLAYQEELFCGYVPCSRTAVWVDSFCVHTVYTKVEADRGYSVQYQFFFLSVPQHDGVKHLKKGSQIGPSIRGLKFDVG